MLKEGESIKDYHCENCANFDESKIPANCLKGKGRVAFHHPICLDFSLYENTGGEIISNGEH